MLCSVFLFLVGPCLISLLVFSLDNESRGRERRLCPFGPLHHANRAGVKDLYDRDSRVGSPGNGIPTNEILEDNTNQVNTHSVEILFLWLCCRLIVFKILEDSSFLKLIQFILFPDR